MPAAAVIPAPIAYAKVVAVKKLVVGFQSKGARSIRRYAPWTFVQIQSTRSNLVTGSELVTLRKLKCSKQAIALNMLA